MTGETSTVSVSKECRGVSALKRVPRNVIMFVLFVMNLIEGGPGLELMNLEQLGKFQRAQTKREGDRERVLKLQEEMAKWDSRG